MEISKQDQDRITKAIRAAEAKTSGEIVCVLAQTSTQAAASPIFIAAVMALVLPWLLTAFTSMTVVRILSLQVITFLVKVVLVGCFMIQIRWSLPRFRYDQLMKFGWKLLLPLSALNLVVTACVRWFILVKG